MYKVQVKNKETLQVTNEGTFETYEQANEWISLCEESKAFGHFQEESVDNLGNVVPAIEKPYTIEITDISLVLEQERVNQESLEYLRSTDWYVTRFVETGVPVPNEITQARALARTKIV